MIRSSQSRLVFSLSKIYFAALMYDLIVEEVAGLSAAKTWPFVM